MDRYSKSSEGIHRGSKVARNTFGSSTSPHLTSSHGTSTANHSTQTGNEHVRFNNTISSNNTAHHNYNKAHRGTNNNNIDLRDVLSMATKDKVVQQQLQNSQFYQRGIHDSLTVANTGKNTKDVEDEEAAVATDEEAEIDRKLDPYLYDNVQYS
ncbi:hypothetical protein BG015_000726 [Linnemannia schmuckeri]|uniref:Uncharacterized protein n=1 Tax=Linnemannia schmuckeri TaxID=64567 RepID=A0A9P5V792_9FUNG|nr:hypothetical protein BG015_000726 [Linnemannia schmuckeri]